MKYINLIEQLKDFTVFSLTDIKRIEPQFHRTRLNEWQNKGYLKKIIKGHYIFATQNLNENVLFEIANRIYAPSYVSLEMAFSWYHLIPESVYGITSVSTRRTYAIQSVIGNFIYKAIKPELFFGYELIKYNNKHFKMASVEKSLLDYFYLNPHLKHEADFSSLRFNSEFFLNRFNRETLLNYLDRFAQKSLSNRIKSFLSFLEAGE